MKRFIIALLALLGLIAQAGPVSARMSGAEAAQHGVVIGRSVQGQKLIVRQAVRQAHFAQPERRENVSTGVQHGTYLAVLAPTVNIGIDRARQ